MSGPAALAFPGGRTLGGWWRQLTSLQPQCLWVGHLFFHHVEALIELTQTCRIDPIDLLILKGLKFSSGEPLERLEERLLLGEQLLHQVLRRLAAAGLVTAEAHGWVLTAPGMQAVERGEYIRPQQQRRSFYFLDNTQGGQPHFLHLTQPDTVAWQPERDWSFDPIHLQACINQRQEWKVRHTFPSDVEKLILPSPPLSSPSNWRQVMIDRSERLAAALVLSTDADGERLLGFGVRPEGWTMQTEQPVLALDAEWRGVFPDLAGQPVEEDWKQAWQAWCQPRGLIGVSGEASAWRPEGHRLIVTVTARLMERLRSTRSDVLRDEAWVLAGTGRIRRAALLKVVEAEAKGG
jgi:hypothetical protein